MMRYAYQRPVLVCVTAQHTCRRIIEEGQQMAARLGTQVEVITVQPRKQVAEQRSKAMKCLYQLSHDTHQEITIYYSDHPVSRIVRHAKDADAMHILTGKPDHQNDFVGQLSLMTGLPITMVGEEVICTLPPAFAATKPKLAFQP